MQTLKLIVPMILVAAVAVPGAQVAGGQTKAATTPTTSATPPGATAAVVAPAAVPTPPDYLIGPDDVLGVVFWRDKDMSSDVAVRPDGKISLPLLNDVQAAGLTPPQLRDRLTELSQQYLEDPNVTIVVRQINSRKVFITGEIARAGTYPLGGPTTILQLIAMAGGIGEYADGKKIVVMRTENGRQESYPFNYEDVVARKNLKQNIELKPGDTIIVP